MTEEERIITRIKKLLSLGEGQANENEAMAALQKARALMREHGLEMADMQVEGDEEGIDVTIETWRDTPRSQYDTWNSLLAGAVAQLFGIESIIYTIPAPKYNKKAYAYVGEKVDVEMAKNVWPWLTKTCKRLAREAIGKGWTASHRSFAEAFAVRVYTRCDQMREQEEAQVAQASAEGQQDEDAKYALVVTAKSEALQLYMAEKYPNLKQARKQSLRGERDYDAIAAGDRAGRDINLNFRNQIGSNGEGSQQHQLR